MRPVIDWIARFLKDEDGANAGEYALLAALLAAAFVVGLALLGYNLHGVAGGLVDCAVNDCARTQGK